VIPQPTPLDWGNGQSSPYAGSHTQITLLGAGVAGISAGEADAHKAARRAFSLTFSITQRDALLDVAGAMRLVLDVVVGTVPVDAASERRGRDGKISPDHAHPTRHVRMLRGTLRGNASSAS
jgi:hypothetical protein